MVTLLPSQATKPIIIYSPEVTTTITIEAPNDTWAGVSFQVTGQLTRDDGGGLPDQPVKLFSNDNLLATAQTSATGWYLFNVNIATPGTYTLKAVFEGADVAGYIKRLNGSNAKTKIGKTSLESLQPYLIPAVIVAATAYLLKKI